MQTIHKSLNNPDYYLKRYAISSCMQETEVRYLKNGGKSSNWKKAVKAKINLQETNWKNLDIKESIVQTKFNVKDIEMDEADDKKTYFITLRFEDKDTFTFTANKEVLDCFYCAISYILNKKVTNDFFITHHDELSALIVDRSKFQRRIDKDMFIPTLPPEPTCFPNIDPKVLENGPTETM